jgi:hypothetical protein
MRIMAEVTVNLSFVLSILKKFVKVTDDASPQGEGRKDPERDRFRRPLVPGGQPVRTWDSSRVTLSDYVVDFIGRGGAI